MRSLDTLTGYANAGVHVLTVSQNLEDRQKVTDFFREHGYRSLQPYLDSNMALMTAIGASTLPVTILSDASGREVWRKRGIEDWASEEAGTLIREGRRD